MNHDGSRLHCPRCGNAMNPHARKRLDPRSAREATQVDPELGGIVREIHACSRCGELAVRTLPPPTA